MRKLITGIVMAMVFFVGCENPTTNEPTTNEPTGGTDPVVTTEYVDSIKVMNSFGFWIDLRYENTDGEYCGFLVQGYSADTKAYTNAIKRPEFKQVSSQYGTASAINGDGKLYIGVSQNADLTMNYSPVFVSENYDDGVLTIVVRERVESDPL